MIKIKDWGSFERRDTHRVKGSLPWLALPVDLQSSGLVRLRLRPNGRRAFGTFVLLLEYAASRFVGQRDGTISTDNATLAATLFVDATEFVDDLNSLASIGWIEIDGEHAATVPQQCRNSAAEVPQQCRTPAARIGLDRIGLDRIGLDKDLPQKCRRSAADSEGDQSPPLAGKPRGVKRKPPPPPTGTDDVTPYHVLSAWDARFQRSTGAPYVRTAARKEVGLAKTLIDAVRATGLNLAQMGEAMDRFLADDWGSGKGFSVFVASFAQFAAEKKPRMTGERFGKDDSLWRLANGDTSRNGATPGLPSRALSVDEPGDGGDSGGLATPVS